jgi:hypothetical protein
LKDGQHSAPLSAAYDVRTSISVSLNLEKNGLRQSFTGDAKFDKESAILSVQTPFEGMRTMGLSGRLVDASNVNVSSDRTATLHFEKEGQSQDYALPKSFDANLAALSNETPFQNYEKMSAEVCFVLDKLKKRLSTLLSRRKSQNVIQRPGKKWRNRIEIVYHLKRVRKCYGPLPLRSGFTC